MTNRIAAGDGLAQHGRCGRFVAAAFVEGQRDIAVAAVQRIVATRAIDKVAVAAAVEQEDGLFFSGQAQADLLFEDIAEERDFLAAPLGEHIDQPHLGHRQVGHAMGQAGQLVVAADAGVVQRFQRGRRRAEDAVGPGKLGPLDGGVAAVVAGDGVLLVAGFVLLIDDDQAELRQRGKDGRAGADDHIGQSFADLLPLGVALRGREATVHHGDPRETAAEPLDGLGGQGDFGQQDDGAFAGGDGPLDRADIDLRFAAVGDAVEQRDAEGLRVDAADDLVEGLALVVVEDHFVFVQPELFGHDRRRMQDLAADELDDAAAGEILERGILTGGTVEQFFLAEGQRFLRRTACGQQRDDRFLFCTVEGGEDFRILFGEIDQNLGRAADILFDGAGDHRGQDLAERADIILADPLGQLEELFIEQRLGIREFFDGLELEAAALGGLFGIEHGNAETLHLFVALAEGHEHPSARLDGADRRRHGVIEQRIGAGIQGHADDGATVGSLRPAFRQTEFWRSRGTLALLTIEY